ncbi:thioredoxin family protein, general stress protein ytxJ-like protein, ytxJ [Deinococcus grandis]|uniref:Thioredoxin family protein, general stress protein ytxJ-like protein, ytxJ n=1 Tax=Deinococcus grandis TaxID=57498 RepID=A0A117DN81_9DEIO|nr:monothiol bacilliredoxin BrxC family protein [Deinococcus grandis]BBN95282.1 thioredoxin [Deinococcus grandis]GAQ21227.1 thioredoxin family protein, general stress protein ytxJ-like protein, ytxJ [Deinococcus grandis]
MTQAAQNEAQVLVPLTTPEEVDQFLTEYPLAAVFKAGTCHKTMQGFGVLETFLQRHDLPVGFIRVVDWRPASNHVAQLTGIQHHSPQLILFQDGQPQFEVNNWDITPQALGPVFEAHVPVREGVASVATDDNVEPYRRLMRAFLDGQLSDWAFQDQYVNMFRDDASLRSQREFELLSRLFGDPDAYHGGLHQLGAPQGRGDLKARVQELLTELG